MSLTFGKKLKWFRVLWEALLKVGLNINGSTKRLTCNLISVLEFVWYKIFYRAFYKIQTMPRILNWSTGAEFPKEIFTCFDSCPWKNVCRLIFSYSVWFRGCISINLVLFWGEDVVFIKLYLNDNGFDKSLDSNFISAVTPNFFQGFLQTLLIYYTESVVFGLSYQKLLISFSVKG